MQTKQKVQRHLYSTLGIGLLTLGTLIGEAFFIVALVMTPPDGAPTNGGAYELLAAIGCSLLLLTYVGVMLTDRRGLITLNGWVRWGRMNGVEMYVMAMVLLAISPIWLLIYLAQSVQTYYRAQRRAPIEQQLHTAQLEASLGLQPLVEGTCQACQKPLQLGAKVCAYCGEPTQQQVQPRICSNCATVTFPDAKFCPNCQQPLDEQEEEEAWPSGGDLLSKVKR